MHQEQMKNQLGAHCYNQDWRWWWLSLGQWWWTQRQIGGLKRHFGGGIITTWMAWIAELLLSQGTCFETQCIEIISIKTRIEPNHCMRFSRRTIQIQQVEETPNNWSHPKWHNLSKEVTDNLTLEMIKMGLIHCLRFYGNPPWGYVSTFWGKICIRIFIVDLTY